MLQIYLHVLYNEDILDEAVILNWHSNPGNHDDHIVESQKKPLREMVLIIINIHNNSNELFKFILINFLWC